MELNKAEDHRTKWFIRCKVEGVGDRDHITKAMSQHEAKSKVRRAYSKNEVAFVGVTAMAPN